MIKLSFKNPYIIVVFAILVAVLSFVIVPKMPVDIFIDGKEVRITPTDEWGDLKENIALNKIEVNDLEFYIKTSYKK